MSIRVETDVEEWNGRDVKIRGKRVRDRSAFEIGLVVQGQAKSLAPVRLGRLRGSITVQSESGDSTHVIAPATAADEIGPPSDEGEVFVGTAVDYGPHIEFGTVRSEARAFLRPALDLAQGRELTIVKRNAEFFFGEYLRRSS